eukprot:129992_1
MEAIYLLFTVIYGITSVKSLYTKFKWNYTSEVCSVRECTGISTGCTDYVPITDALAQTYISNDGSCHLSDLSCAVSDWVWPSAYFNDASGTSVSIGCKCPLCSCDTLDEMQYFKEVGTSFTYCYDCKCSDQSSWTYGDGSAIPRAYSCTTLTYEMGLDDAEIAAFPCPPPICGTFNGEIKYEGYSWLDQSDTSGERFCLCQSDGNALCSSSYEGIVSDPLLNEKFTGCDIHLHGECRADASSWFNPLVYTGAIVYNMPCPRCGCDIEGVNGYFTDTDEYGNKDCYECTCDAFTDANANGYNCGSSPIYSLDADELETKSWSCPNGSYASTTQLQTTDFHDEDEALVNKVCYLNVFLFCDAVLFLCIAQSMHI